MSMFRRPTDDSSDSDTEDDGSADEQEEVPVSVAQHHPRPNNDDPFGPDLTATETLSSGESISVGSEPEAGPIANAEHHRNMMLASLLEEFYRSRAAELYNAATPGSNFHRQSAEIQPLAQTLFAQASQDLVTAGILPASAISNNLQNARKQYLFGFDNLGLQNLRDSNLLPESIKRRISQDDGSQALIKAGTNPPPEQSHLIDRSIRDLAIRTGNLNIAPHPANDMRLSSLHQWRSHYKSSFQETRLLGKGGFGRVYQTRNVLDQREYAVKKIPLSPTLSRRYQQHGHTELHNVLREVQALAQLDHCNVVRYHATWIEEPSQSSTIPLAQTGFVRSLPSHRLLDDKPAFSSADRPAAKDLESVGVSKDNGDILFEVDSHASNIQRGDAVWSKQIVSRQPDQSTMNESDLFTDGVAKRASQDSIADDPSCYVLHVQMSMYPSTLTQYLLPAPNSTTRSPIVSTRRHCFHLIPTLRLLLGILCGLQYVHAKGLVHRDIKPSNVFLSMHESPTNGTIPEGYHNVGTCSTCRSDEPFFINPRIGDFGLVADLAHGDQHSPSSSPRSSDKAVGTQYYYPPSSSRGRGSKSAISVDEKLDVFALGIILVEMLWCCNTAMERLDLLKSLQEGCIPPIILQNLTTSYGSVTETLVRELILGMIDHDAGARWSCSLVQQRLERIIIYVAGATSAAQGLSLDQTVKEIDGLG